MLKMKSRGEGKLGELQRGKRLSSLSQALFQGRIRPLAAHQVNIIIEGRCLIVKPSKGLRPMAVICGDGAESSAIFAPLSDELFYQIAQSGLTVAA